MKTFPTAFMESTGKSEYPTQTVKGRPITVWLYDPFSFTPWYTSALALALKDQDIQVRLLCGTLTQEPDYYYKVGLESDRKSRGFGSLQSKLPAPMTRVLRLFQASLKLNRLIHAFRSDDQPLPDILHLQQLPMLDRGLRIDFALINHAQRAGVSVVHTVHNILPHNLGKGVRELYAELYGRVDHLICHSDYACERLTQEFNIPRHRITIIPHGPLFAPPHVPSERDRFVARSRLKLPHDSIIFLWQGVLSEYKGLDVLLNAWKNHVACQVFPTSIRPLLLIAGSGPDRLQNAARGMATQIGDSVRSELRYIPSSELPDFYTAADILVYPYKAITTSGALLTGLSYAKPIVASRLEPFQDYLEHGENAILVEAGDSDDLGSALYNLVCDVGSMKAQPSGGVMSNDYCSLSAGAARNSARYVSWAAIAGMTNSLYRRLAVCS